MSLTLKKQTLINLLNKEILVEGEIKSFIYLLKDVLKTNVSDLAEFVEAFYNDEVSNKRFLQICKNWCKILSEMDINNPILSIHCEYGRILNNNLGEDGLDDFSKLVCKDISEPNLKTKLRDDFFKRDFSFMVFLFLSKTDEVKILENNNILPKGWLSTTGPTIEYMCFKKVLK